MTRTSLPRHFAAREPVPQAVNANETERIGAVVQELKPLADTQELAAVFTSDTTKASVMGDSTGDGLELRGSYQLAHLATVILTLRASDDVHDLAKRAEKLNGTLIAEIIERSAPSWLRTRTDATKLGARYALMHCAKARRGPPTSFAMGFIPGVGSFVESIDDVFAETTGKNGKKPVKDKPVKPVRIVLELSEMAKLAVKMKLAEPEEERDPT